MSVLNGYQQGRIAKMNCFPEGNAIVYCEAALATTNGKTAHGLLRRSERYRILSVVDSKSAGKDAGLILDGQPTGMIIDANVKTAVQKALEMDHLPTHLVIGLAPDGGRLGSTTREDIKTAIKCGLNIDSGLHDFLTEDPELVALARKYHVRLRDVRKPPPKESLHFFSGKIETVNCLKIAILGTDSAVGKRTSAWLLLDGFRAAHFQAELVGTGQTAGLQGARFSIVLDALINDFVAGEIEHAVWSAWNSSRPRVILIEGQGSLMHPAYPGGFEILAAARPDVVVLQHAPARKNYDGFPNFPIHTLEQQIQAIEMVSGKPVVAITINHENLLPADVPYSCHQIEQATHIPAFDILLNGVEGIISTLIPYLKRQTKHKL